LPDAPTPPTSKAGTPAAKAPAPTEPAAVVIDATGLVLGRAASVIAPRLLRGEHLIVVNAERCVVTGSRTSVLAEYTARRARGSVRSGPHYPRYPDRIFRRSVRGMLPHLKTRGREALDRLEVYIGVPPELTDRPTITLEQARPRPALRTPLSLDEISRLLGAKL
jgi:large subunit ribosomal protein L13